MTARAMVDASQAIAANAIAAFRRFAARRWQQLDDIRTVPVANAMVQASSAIHARPRFHPARRRRAPKAEFLLP